MELKCKTALMIFITGCQRNCILVNRYPIREFLVYYSLYTNNNMVLTLFLKAQSKSLVIINQKSIIKHTEKYFFFQRQWFLLMELSQVALETQLEDQMCNHVSCL